MQPPSAELYCYAELDPDDGFIMLASANHDGSANTTTDQEQHVFSYFMIKGILRQEENQCLADSIESIKQHDARLQMIIGYAVSIPWLRWVDVDDPRDLLLDEG
ncbi:hypothetical protein F5884DRAFT_832523 [Xylogone sp. PMI_703]|nr:hypothetical protein F5884DRAFT_832523 [Xylogone sp. PMI_703]